MTTTLWADVPFDQRGEPWMTRRRHPRLWWTEDHRRLVRDGDPEADTLAIGENAPPTSYGLRVLLDTWLARHQPYVPIGCAAAVRDRHGLFHPCRNPRGEGRPLCRSHDPEILAARRAARSLLFQWCNWVGEGVPT